MQEIRKQILPLTAFYMNECSWQESKKSITALEKPFLKVSINLNHEQVHGITLLIVNVWFPLKENKNYSDSNSICCDYTGGVQPEQVGQSMEGLMQNNKQAFTHHLH